MFIPETLELRKSLIHGLGIFSNQTIPKNTVLGEYTGSKYSLKEFKNKYGNNTEHCYVARRQNYVICAKDQRNWISYVNESKEPNCKLISRLLTTTKEIKKDEELFLTYPKNYPRNYKL